MPAPQELPDKSLPPGKSLDAKARQILVQIPRGARGDGYG